MKSDIKKNIFNKAVKKKNKISISDDSPISEDKDSSKKISKVKTKQTFQHKRIQSYIPANLKKPKLNNINNKKSDIKNTIDKKHNAPSGKEEKNKNAIKKHKKMKTEINLYNRIDIDDIEESKIKENRNYDFDEEVNLDDMKSIKLDTIKEVEEEDKELNKLVTKINNQRGYERINNMIINNPYIAKSYPNHEGYDAYGKLYLTTDNIGATINIGEFDEKTKKLLKGKKIYTPTNTIIEGIFDLNGNLIDGVIMNNKVVTMEYKGGKSFEKKDKHDEKESNINNSVKIDNKKSEKDTIKKK